MSMAATVLTPVDRVLEALRSGGYNPKQSGAEWYARCPAHDDSSPSLGVRESPTGNALILCYAGCPTQNVARALNLNMADLFPPKSPKVSQIGPHGRIKAVYRYVKADGEIAYEVVRYDPKTFKQRRPNGTGYIWNLQGVERIPYQLPQVLKGIKDGKTIWIVEGEKDVENAQWLGGGVIATCNSGGAGKWTSSHAGWLKGAAKVNIIADDDEPGHDHAQQVARSLRGIVPNITIALPAAGCKDLSEHVAAGHGLKELRKQWSSDQPEEWLQDAPQEASDAVDLVDLINEGDDEYDWVVPGVLERGDRVIVTGEEGKGKSTLLRQWGAQIASGIHIFTGEDVPPMRTLIVDLENSRRQVKRKVRALADAAGSRYVKNNLRFIIRPEGLDLTIVEHVAWLEEWIRSEEPDVLIIGPLYKLAGGDPTKEEASKPVALTLDHLRAEFNVVIIMEAHSPYAEGGSKRPERPYGWSGWSRWPEFGLHLAPDGALRHYRGPRDERAWPRRLKRGEPWPWMTVSDEESEWKGPTECMAAVLKFLESAPGQEFSGRQLAAGMKAVGSGFHERTIAQAAEQLACDGRLGVRSGRNRSRLYSLAAAADDPFKDPF